MFTKLTEKLDSFLATGVPGYDCVVYHKGECVYRHQNGYSDRENKIRMKGDEFYNIYSSSKPITCVAALKLYEKGLYSLEDNLSDYMPEFKTMYVQTEDGVKEAENSIKIKHLFSMTAGFSYDLNSPMLELCKKETNGKCPTRETMKYLAKEPLCFEPGTDWKYSLCHDVIAALVEVLSGVKFSEFVKKNIFEPVGMENSTFEHYNFDLDKLCAQYGGQNVELRSKANGYNLGSEYESGGAGCISTVDDYIKFLEALRKGELIKKETIDLMATNYLPECVDGVGWENRYGYGLGVRCPKDDTLTDFGWGGAAGSYLMIDLENEITAFYVQHVMLSPIHSIRGSIVPVITEIIKSNNGV